MGDSNCKSCETFSKSHFCSIKRQALDLMDSSKQHIQFKKNQVIFREGDKPQGLFCISSGSVKLSRIDENGNEILLKVYIPGNIIGYRALFAHESYQATAIAHEDVEVCFVQESVLKNMMEKDLELALSFLKQMSQDIREYEARMASIVTKSVPQRVAEALLVLKRALPDSKWTRKEIAEWAGTTPETVIRTLAQFQEEGLIVQEGRSIQIQNKDLLSNIASFDSYS